MKELKAIGKAPDWDDVKFGNDYFLGIGIDIYQSPQLPHLSNAKNDVKSILQILQGRYSFDKSYSTCLLDESATRENILETLRNLSETIGKSDNLIIYFAGHGSYDQRLDNAYWLPYDSNPSKRWSNISNGELLNIISEIKSLHTILISDSCFSGSFFANYRNLPNLYDIPSRFAMSSGSFSNVVLDGIPNSNSPFASSIISCLKSNQIPFISATNLFNSVLEKVASNTEQLPMYGVMRNTGHEGGEYFFRLRERQSFDESEIWEEVTKENNLETFSSYLSSFPNNEHAKDAKAIILEIERDNFTFQLCSKFEHYKKYLELYPNGLNIGKAKSNMDIDIQELVKDCFSKIYDGKIEHVINQLFKKILETEKGKTYKIEIITLSGRFNSARQSNIWGTQYSQEYTLELNRITQAIVEFLEKLGNE